MLLFYSYLYDLQILETIMREEFKRKMVNRLRNEYKSFTEIGKSIGLSRHVVRRLYMYKRVLHPKKEEKNQFWNQWIN